MSHYLVTGGAGFIGSHVVDVLVANGGTVRIIDNLSTGTRENVLRHARVEFMEADLAEPGIASKAVEGVEYIFHLAAIPSVPRSLEDPIATNRANVDSTLRLLLAARDTNIKRLVFASSSSVYGNSLTLPKHEQMSPQPLSPYALQKFISENYILLFNKLYGLDTVSLRFFNVFGPRQNPRSPYSGVISLFIAALCDGRQPTIYGDGEQTRDFTYVSDVAHGLFTACRADGISGQVINLARGGRTSLNQLLKVLQNSLGTTIKPMHASQRAGDIRDSQADITRARRCLGFEPRVTIEDGLRQTVEWYCDSVQDLEA